MNTNLEIAQPPQPLYSLLKFYTDRSRIVKDWTCPRARFWGYEFQGKGLAKATTNLPLYMGTSVHDALSVIANQYHVNGKVDIDLIADTARKQMLDALLPATASEIQGAEFAWEQATLTEGLIRGFYKQVWPILLSLYPTIVCVEEEMTYDLGGGLTFMSKPDLIMQGEDGEWVYIEYKTTSSKKVEWINSWDTAVQLHSTIKAVEASKGKAPTSVQIVGLYKGYKSYNKQNSPLCYAYKRSGNPPFSRDEISYEWKAGFKKYPVWEMEGGCKKWVDEMSEAILIDQFPLTPQIYVNNDLVNNFFTQVKSREAEIRYGMERLMEDREIDLTHNIIDEVFPQKFDQCSPPYGYGCDFKFLCHGPQNRNPLDMGYTLRTPHHAPEVELWEGGGEG